MHDFTLHDAATMFAGETTTLISLWTVYVVATFAAASYGISRDRPNVIAVAAVTLGFLVFAAGHWSMVCQAIAVQDALRVDLQNAINADKNGPFSGSLGVFASTAYTARASAITHILIDVCVVAALWSGVWKRRAR